MDVSLCPECEHRRETAPRTLVNLLRTRLGFRPLPARCRAVIGSAQSDTGYAQPCACVSPAHGS